MRILLPIDGSDCSEETVIWATSLFDPKTTQYDLLYIWRAIPDAALNVVEFDIDEFLAAHKKKLEEKGFDVAHTQWEMGDPVHQICKYAEKNLIDTVVLGSHGNTGLAKFLLGSVSIGVLEHCKKPVLIHRNRSAKPNQLTEPCYAPPAQKGMLKEISQ